jgi:hypothetical protein
VTVLFCCGLSFDKLRMTRSWLAFELGEDFGDLFEGVVDVVE